MKKSWIKSISLSLACLLGFGLFTTNLVVASKEDSPVKVDAATTTTATLTYSDVLANARSDYKKTTWGNWEWWKVPKKDGAIYAGDNTYFVNSRAYTDGATKIDFSISFTDGYVIPRIEMVATTLATNSNSFSWTITDSYYNENPPKRIYFEDTASGERHIIKSLTITYTFTKYTVSLNSNGGTGGLSSVQVPYNRAMPTISSSNLPTREGYTFQGYYDTSASTGGTKYYNANGTSAKTFTNKDDSLKLYARWALAQKPVNITKGTGISNVYVSSNGNVTNASSSDLKTSGTNFAQGSTVYGYVKLSKGYKALSGWTLKAGTADTEGALYLIGSGTVSSSGYDFGTINASTITYSIDYELSGGAVSTTNPTSYTVETDTFTLNNPTKEGYNFLGWSEEGQTGYKETVTITKGTIGNKKYTANWALVEELQAVVNAINNLGGPTNISYPNSKTDLEYAESLYSALDPASKAILDSDYENLVDELADDRIEYDSLRNDAIDNAIGKIDAINEPVSYPGSRTSIFAARDAINALADEDKINTIVTNLDDYNDALDTYNTLRDIAVNHVIESIENIYRDGEGSVVYPDSKSSLVNAESLYNSLADEEKFPSPVVTNYDDLLQARSDYNTLRENAIQAVIDAIDTINEPFDENRENQISYARYLFDNTLDEDEKSATYITNYQDLLNAEAADAVADLIEALTPADTDEYRLAVQEARDAYTALTPAQQSYIGEDLLKILVDDEKSIEVMDLIHDIGNVTYTSESKDKIDVAQDAYDNLSDDQKALVLNYGTLTQANLDYNKVDESVGKINNIGTVAYTSESKTLIDEARDYYDALSDYQKSIFPQDVIKILEDDEAAYNAMNVINSIGDVNEESSKDRIEAAREVYDALNDDQEVILDLYPEFEKTLVDDEKAREFIDAVNAIGELVDTDESRALIIFARGLYDALTDDQKALINANYVKTLADDEAAMEVITLIGSIGDVTYNGGTDDSLVYITAIENAYNALTDAQKALVDAVNKSILEHDREVYDHVDHVAKLIEAIPEASESQEYYDAVDAAKAAYDQLTDEEKAILGDTPNFNYEKALEDNVAAKEVIKLIEEIGSLSYDDGQNDSLSDIEVAEVAYEL